MSNFCTKNEKIVAGIGVGLMVLSVVLLLAIPKDKCDREPLYAFLYIGLALIAGAAAASLRNPVTRAHFFPQKRTLSPDVLPITSSAHRDSYALVPAQSPSRP